MLLRKSRKHLHGASNRSLNHHQPFATTTNFYPKTNLPPPIINHFASTSHLKKRNMHKKQISLTQADCKDEQLDRVQDVESKLKRIYQGRKNIVKTIDGWGFDSKGFISREEFKQKIKQKIKQELNEDELNNLMLKIGCNYQQVDVKSLINLVHQKSQGVIFNQTMFQTANQSKHRQQLIQNLKENLKCYTTQQKKQLTDQTVNKFLSKVNSSISKLKQNQDYVFPNNKQLFFEEIVGQNHYSASQIQILSNIKNTVDFSKMYYALRAHQNVDSIIIDPMLRKVKPKIQCNSQIQNDSDASQTFYAKMMKSSSNFSETKKSRENRGPFDPINYKNVNQQKTRFGRSNFTKQSTNWISNDFHESVGPNQKDEIMKTLKSDQQVHKIRYQNKLQQLRVFKLQQQQNIAIRQQMAQTRDQHRLERISNQQYAYNYVNFIKKRWQ